MDRSEVRLLVEALEGEVFNGGFDQYFGNGAGDTAAATIQALRAIGATTAAELLTAACAKFPGGMPPSDWAARHEALLVLDPGDLDVFAQLDEAFQAYPDDLKRLLAAYDSRSAA
jgi:Domain of unknown function (DUF4375)